MGDAAAIKSCGDTAASEPVEGWCAHGDGPKEARKAARIAAPAAIAILDMMISLTPMRARATIPVRARKTPAKLSFVVSLVSWLSCGQPDAPPEPIYHDRRGVRRIFARGTFQRSPPGTE
jgi:hypothetical protein